MRSSEAREEQTFLLQETIEISQLKINRKNSLLEIQIEEPRYPKELKGALDESGPEGSSGMTSSRSHPSNRKVCFCRVLLFYEKNIQICKLILISHHKTLV